MLKITMLAVAILFVIACALFNLRVSWANVNGRSRHDRRLVYFIVSEMATAATALIAWETKTFWLIEPALKSETVGDNAGLAYLFLLTLGIAAVITVGIAVWSAGVEGETFWAAKKVARHN